MLNSRAIQMYVDMFLRLLLLFANVVWCFQQSKFKSQSKIATDTDYYNKKSLTYTKWLDVCSYGNSTLPSRGFASFIVTRPSRHKELSYKYYSQIWYLFMFPFIVWKLYFEHMSFFNLRVRNHVIYSCMFELKDLVWPAVSYKMLILIWMIAMKLAKNW